jgi:xanthine dehydrogenase YagS FAD-binding subunit
MKPFIYSRASSRQAAITEMLSHDKAKFIGGGTNILDLMKLDVESPERIIDINSLDLRQIEELPGGGMKIGALVRNSDLAYHAVISKRYPVLSQALLSGASPQLRNMATAGGNLMQRTRCPYFYDVAYACNKRAPGSGCAAINGYNRSHAILGTSDKCIATHPSDMCVALAALEAQIYVQGANGTRMIPFSEFHLAPGDAPEKETSLQQGELITSIQVPALPFAGRSAYVKVRDRSSYEFALASAAVALNISGGKITQARIAMGGIGTKPWKMKNAEKALEGMDANTGSYQRAADLALQNAKTYKFNSFKVELAKRTLVHALETAAAII